METGDKMIDIMELERNTNNKYTQSEFAKLITFGFNSNLISIATNSLNEKEYGKLLNTIVENKFLLSTNKESITYFFDRVACNETVSLCKDSIKPFIKSGISLLDSETFLTSKLGFVSLNEYDYCIRRGPWYIECVNEHFNSIINSNLKDKFIVVSSEFPVSVISSKCDVVSFEDNIIKLMNGDVYKCIIF